MMDTLENKIKFLQTCIGDYTLEANEGIESMCWRIHSVDLNGNVFVIHDRDDQPHKLNKQQLKNIRVVKKQLSSMSNEDGIKICNMVHPTIENDVDKFKIGKRLVTEALYDYDYTIFEGSKVVDYIGSQGYAIPKNGVSVENQIKYGWIVII